MIRVLSLMAAPLVALSIFFVAPVAAETPQGVAPEEADGTLLRERLKKVRLRADPFSSLVGETSRARRQATPVGVERYVIASDDRVFLFENLGATARLRFLCNDADERIECQIDRVAPAEEIHELTPVRAGRGDVIYKNETGASVVRMASYGGATVYWPEAGRGLAASKSYGEDPSLRLEPADTETVERRLRNATAIVSARIGAPISFIAKSPALVDASGGAVLADAIARVASGLGRVARDETGALYVAKRISRVVFEPAAQAGLALTQGTLFVRYDPDGGIDGRLSSAQVAAYLEGAL